MRTTITLDDGLLVELKRRASEAGSSVSRLIEIYLRQMMSRKSDEVEDGKSFKLVTYGRGGRFSRHNIDKASALVELEDLERYGAAKG